MHRPPPAVAQRRCAGRPRRASSASSCAESSRCFATPSFRTSRGTMPLKYIVQYIVYSYESDTNVTLDLFANETLFANEPVVLSSPTWPTATWTASNSFLLPPCPANISPATCSVTLSTLLISFIFCL